MSDNNDIVTTSISISRSLYKAAKAKAALEYRSFSQHVSYLIDLDLKRQKRKDHAEFTGGMSLPSRASKVEESGR